MVQDNYYLILGVSPSESPAGIRARYRDLARILHPDVAGEQSTVAFQKVAEAYAVLADPQARRRHDADLATWQDCAPVRFAADPSAPGRREPMWLTPEEAARGVEVPIAVPGAESCFECGGSGRVWLFPCASCRGQGLIVTEKIVRVPVPPLVRPESIIEMPLHWLGIHNLYLRLYVRIE